jgi:hypothetical protein
LKIGTWPQLLHVSEIKLGKINHHQQQQQQQQQPIILSN